MKPEILKLNNLSHKEMGPIGVFDSGYGGLTILNAIRQHLPQYDYLYLGDNARTPYGTRSFEVVYHYTLECVKKLFEMNCHLVILACNTASAKALRTIQQRDLPGLDSNRRVLGVIRPTAEAIGSLTVTRHVGLVGTTGTIQSHSYPLEIAKLFPDIVVNGEACPMWVPLVENGEYDSEGADYFVKKNLDHLFSVDPQIDTLILGCTHYPLLVNKIQKYLPKHVALVIQGDIVADSLADYMKRHPEMEQKCSQGGECHFLTTEAEEKFAASASVFMAENIDARQIQL
jgi:glutamate racemase